MGADARDKIYWGRSASGVFTAKTASRLLREDADISTIDPIWRSIWKVKTHERTLQFLCAHDSFLCNANRVRRHLADVSACPRCGLDETTLHVLRDCGVIDLGWRALSGNSIPPYFFTTTNVKDWVFLNIKHHDDWASLFAVMIWFMWKCRNKLVFQGQDLEMTISSTVVDQFRLYKTAMNRNIPSLLPNSSTVVIHPTHWTRPPPGWIKLNSDGASKGIPGLTGGGGIFRNEVGEFIHGFMISEGFGMALFAELSSICHDLHLGLVLGLTHLIVETDSLEACKLLELRHLFTHAHYYIIKALLEAH